MAHVSLVGDPVDLSEPWLVEGLPGVGLVGKIATDHLIEVLDMDYYAGVYCEGLPSLGVYHEGERGVQPPVRLYVDPETDLLALRSDVPVSPSGASEFATCMTGWFADHDVTPVYLSGYPEEKGPDVPAMFGVATGEAAPLLDGIDADRPGENGVISGPTGALVHEASVQDLDSVALVVESDPNFPDPEAARVLIDRGIEPLTGVDVDVAGLVDHAEEIRESKERLAQRMQEADEESSQAQPLRMFQ